MAGRQPGWWITGPPTGEPPRHAAPRDRSSVRRAVADLFKIFSEADGGRVEHVVDGCEGTADRRAQLGQELRQARERASLSQRALGRLVDRDRSSISRIESDGSTNDAAWWKLADDRTDAGGVVAGAWLAVMASEHGLSLEAAIAWRDGSRAPLTGAGARLELLGDDGCRCSECLVKWVRKLNLNRRDATRLITILTATASSPDGLSRTARALGSGQVDPRVIDEIDAVITVSQRQEDNLGPSVALPAMLTQRQVVEDLLSNCTDETRPRLLVAFGRASISLARYAADLGDYAAASRYCEDARRVAHEARDVPLAAYALYSIAHFADRSGKYDVSADAGIAAGRLVQGCDDGQLRALIAETVAGNHARRGNARACMRALESACESVDSRAATSHAYWFSRGTLLSRASISEIRLGQHAQAVTSATAGLDLLTSSTNRDRAFCLTRLADARVLAGETPEATRLLADAADLAMRYGHRGW